MVTTRGNRRRQRRRQRSWWHPRRIDVLFGVGMVGFLAQLLREKPSEAMIYGSLILMGVPFVQRIDNPPPRRDPEPDDDDEDDGAASPSDPSASR